MKTTTPTAVIADKREAATPARATANNSPNDAPGHTLSHPTLQAAFSWFDSVNDSEPNDICNMREWVGIVRSDRYRATTDKIRAIKAALPADCSKEEAVAAKKKIDVLKKTLPAVTFSASMDTRDKAVLPADRNYQHSGILQIDVDHKDNPGVPMDEIRARLKAHPSVVMVASSPSNAIKAACAIPACVDTHKQAFTAAQAALKAIGVNIDGSTHDIPRLCFLTHDPEAWIREEAAEVIDISLADGQQTRKKGIVIKCQSERDEITLADLDAMVRCTPRLPHDEWVNFINGAWNHFGEAATAVFETHWPEEKPNEYQERFASGYTQGIVKIGTCIRLAQIHGGYQPPIRARMASLNIPRDHAERVAESVENGKFLAALGDDHRGLAQAYADIRFSQRCFVHDEKIWRFYDGGIWKRDDTGTTLDDLQFALTPLLIESVNDAVRKMDPKKERAKIEAIKKRARCLYNLRTARAVLENAQVLPEFRAMRGDFDQAPHLLAIENGVIDFSTGGEFIAHSPVHMLTASAPITFDIDAKCPTFDQFLADVTCGDADLAEFHLESLAIAMTGYTDNDFVWFNYGDGSNGKGTFTQTVEALMGARLFKTFDSGLLVGNRENSSDDYKRASLEGIRLALADELPDGKKLRTEELKKLIGGDAIQGRNPYERPREFRPSHKVWMAGNHRPEITSMDHGTWRRLLLIPWNARFTGSAGPPRAERVAAHVREASGILNRTMVAWARVHQRGLVIPSAVKSASAEYKRNSDQVGEFVAACVKRVNEMAIALKFVRIAYDEWCESEGEKPIAASNRKLGEELRRLGFETRSGAGNVTMLENAIVLSKS